MAEDLNDEYGLNSLVHYKTTGMLKYAHVGRNSVSSIGQNQSLMSLLYKFSAKLIFFFRKLVPESSNLAAVCTILSNIASAAVELDFIMSYQFTTGSWLIIMVDFLE